MNADNEASLGRYRPKPGDKLLAEQLVPDAHKPEVIHVDQLEVDIDEVVGDRVKVTTTSIGEDAIDLGSQYSNEVPLSDLLHSRFGGYEITRLLNRSETPLNAGSDWRALSKLQGMRRRRS